MNMKELRENMKLRTVDVASLVGVSDSTVRNWEQGRTIPKLRVDQFIKLLEVYDCNAYELFEAIKDTNGSNLINPV